MIIGLENNTTSVIYSGEGRIVSCVRIDDTIRIECTFNGLLDNWSGPQWMIYASAIDCLSIEYLPFKKTLPAVQIFSNGIISHIEHWSGGDKLF